MTDIVRPPHVSGATPPLEPDRSALDAQVIVAFAALATCHFHHDLHCGLSVLPVGRAPETVAATDEVPVRLDWLQHQLRQGPAFDPGASQVLVSRDLAADPRWPDFGRLCVATMDVRALVSVRVPVPSPERAVLTLFSGDPSILDHLDLDAALRLAPLAGQSAALLIDEFGATLRRAGGADAGRVALALAIVADQYRVGPALAFRLLLRVCRDTDQPLLGLAIEVVARGRLDHHARPATRSRSSRHHGGPEMWHDWSRPA